MKTLIDDLFHSQERVWRLAAKNYKDLERVALRKIHLGKTTLVLQFNPGRIVSSSAKVDAKSLAERPCFLCKDNLPAVQEGISLSDGFILLVNPFPILRKHFTLVNTQHTPQRFLPYFLDFLKISEQLGREYTVFYNGPKCGASAPDHMHFQAGLSVQFPIWENLNCMDLQTLYTEDFTTIQAFEGYVKGILLESVHAESLTVLITRIIDILSDMQPQEEEPMLNVLVKYENGWKVVLFPRQKHRPSQYYEEGKKQLLLSPASVDFGGLLAIPRKEDFECMDAALLTNVFEQLCLQKVLFQELITKIREL